MKNQGKIMENKEKNEEIGPTTKKNKFTKQEKESLKKSAPIYIYLI